MKSLKTIFKPFVVLFVLLGMGCLTLIKKAIMFCRVKPAYQYISKINRTMNRLYSVAFNPYRISNGIRPWHTTVATPSAADLEFCHKMLAERRRQSA